MSYRRLGISVFFLLSLNVGVSAQTLPCSEGQADLRAVRETHLLPPYPELSRQLGEQGTTIVKVSVGKDGVPVEAAVDQSSGSPRLDDAAVSAVKLVYRWKPLRTPCPTAVTRVAVQWSLQDAPGTVDPTLHVLRVDPSDYPPGANAKGEEGLAILSVELNDFGVVLATRLLTGSGFADLDAKAVQLVTKHDFQAAQVDKKPVHSWVRVGIAFVR